MAESTKKKVNTKSESTKSSDKKNKSKEVKPKKAKSTAKTFDMTWTIDNTEKLISRVENGGYGVVKSIVVKGNKVGLVIESKVGQFEQVLHTIYEGDTVGVDHNCVLYTTHITENFDLEKSVFNSNPDTLTKASIVMADLSRGFNGIVIDVHRNRRGAGVDPEWLKSFREAWNLDE